jgi:hypothetical protein
MSMPAAFCLAITSATASATAASSAAAASPSREQLLDHLGGARQAAGVGGENPGRAAPHGSFPRFREHLTRSAAGPLDSAAPVGADFAHWTTDQRAKRRGPTGEAIMTTSKHDPALQPVAGNELLDRRLLLRRGLAFAGATAGMAATGAAAEPLADDPWSRMQGTTTVAIEPRSKFEDKVTRTLSNPKGEPRTQHARTPHQMLQGTITPNQLHFTIIHNGTPDIDPAQHKLVIHGLVKNPLVFTMDALARYPMESRMAFVECGGNSAPMFSKEPIQASVQALHGLVSCAEWTGVRLRPCWRKPASIRRRSG